MNDTLPPAAIVGTFDVRNYGDLLFPLLAQWRLAAAGIAVQAYSPAGAPTGWADTADCLPIAELMARPETHSAILIGGGNIIHLGAARLIDYPRQSQGWAYPALWLGASAAAALGNVPVLWNAPGVSAAFRPAMLQALVHPALGASEYVCVRDDASRAFLQPPASTPVAVVPDTAADLARMWPLEELRPHWQALLQRKAADPQARHFAVHPKLRAFHNESPQAIAGAIDAHARRTGLTPLLLAIGECHDDQVAVRRVAQAMQVPRVVLDDPAGLREIACAIACAEHYVGCSLHGYITAASYGVPGRIVAQPRLPKHAGFADHLGRAHEVVDDWAAAFDGVAADVAGPRVTQAVTEALDAHWARIRQGILQPRAGLYVERTRWLRVLVRRGLAQGGLDWMQPAIT